MELEYTVECVFPIVISFEFRMGQLRYAGQREYAPHFIISPMILQVKYSII